MAKNSDTWIKEQITARGIEDTPQTRRELRAEYYQTDPYGMKTGGKPVTTTSATASTVTQNETGTNLTSSTGDADLATLIQEAQGSSGATTGPFAGTSYSFPARVINNTPDNLKAAQNDALLSGANTISTVPGRAGRIVVYSGDQLVNEDGNVVRGQYDRSGKDLLAEYRTITNQAQLIELFTTLKDYNFYGDGGKPSAFALSGRGLENKDEVAFQRFLDYSSSLGRTWRAVLPIVQGGAKLVSGGGRTVSVVSTEDATKLFRQKSLQLLGRMPTANEIDAAVKQIQATERSRGAGGSMDAPSLETAAELAAQKAAPEEAAAQSVGNAMNRIFALLGGR